MPILKWVIFPYNSLCYGLVFQRKEFLQWWEFLRAESCQEEEVG
jgi:hypothetical protein